MASDSINGGAGNDTVSLTGNYAAGLTFGASTMTNVETLKLGAGFNYKLKTNDATVAAGATLSVVASALLGGNVVNFDGSSETNGKFVFQGGAGGDTFIGGAGDDLLSGLGGDDQLNGGGGVNSLDGGLGADKLDGTGGLSTADYHDADQGQTIDLLNPSLNAGDAAAGDTYIAIHRVLGSSHNDKVSGDNQGDVLNGGAGDNSIVGGARADALVGGLGADTLTGGGGADTFQYNFATEGGDVITDFSAAQGDHLAIWHLGFGGGLPSSGSLDTQQFVAGTAPTAAIGQFLWNSSASTLSWDVDGTGSRAAVQIAVLKGVTTLSASNITLV